MAQKKILPAWRENIINDYSNNLLFFGIVEVVEGFALFLCVVADGHVFSRLFFRLYNRWWYELVVQNVAVKV